MKMLIAASLFALSVAVATADPPDGKPAQKVDGKKAAASLEGGYTIVSGEKAGKAIPEAEIKGSVVMFTGDKILGTDKDKKEFFSATFTLDASKTPWVIDMTSKEPKAAKATGLIKKEGDTIVIVYALPGAETPKEFKTKEGQQLFVLKALNKGDKGKGPGKP
ncbi:MAG: TIGR03067 domain-containing protein [Planctomycetes bacterium]|nr:TIGR03067 domain-containing protein [Planctomycetota bacterium]